MDLLLHYINRIKPDRIRKSVELNCQQTGEESEEVD